MVVPPTPEEEDRRRICRERAILLRGAGSATRTASKACSPDRVQYGVQSLAQGPPAATSTPLAPGTVDRFRTNSRAEILREIELIDLLVRQIADVEAERELLVGLKASKTDLSPIMLLQQLKGIGPEIASVLYLEGLFRSFGNRRQLAAYAGLAPTPWRSGTADREQGISKAGNPQLAQHHDRTSLGCCGSDISWRAP